MLIAEANTYRRVINYNNNNYYNNYIAECFTMKLWTYEKINEGKIKNYIHAHWKS